MSARCVAHIDMDAFYVSVELRRRPELRGKPVIVAGRGPRAVVTTASYEARRYGVGSAIPVSVARRLCPQATLIAPDFAHYRAVSAQVMGIIRSHVETVEVVGLDEAYLDLTDLPAPKACMRLVLTEIAERTGLSASVGIGPNKLVAKVASDAEKPRGFLVLTRREACERFAASSCRLIPGIGERTAERLGLLGVRTVAELAGADPGLLRGEFSSWTTAHLQALARFEHDGAVTQERKVVSESRERTFDRDISDRIELEASLATLVDELCEALSDQRRSGRTVAIKVRLADFTTHTRAQTLAIPVRQREDVGRVALALLRAFTPARPVRLLGVRVAGLASDHAAAEQLALTL